MAAIKPIAAVTQRLAAVVKRARQRQKSYEAQELTRNCKELSQ